MNNQDNPALDARKAAIAAFLKQSRAAEPDAVISGTGEGPQPLSFGQERLWVLDKMGAGAAYNISVTIRLDGELDAEAMSAALRDMVARHAILRTRLHADGGKLTQVAVADARFEVGRIDLATLDPQAAAAALAALEQEDSARLYDLETGPLFSARLVRMAASSHVLLLAMHHIVWDGWSGGIFGKELGQIYLRRLEKKPAALPPARQYAEYAAWQRSPAMQQQAQTQLAFWRAELDGAPALLTLPCDHPRPQIQSYEGAVHGFNIDAATATRLGELARGRRATLFTVLLSAYYVLLARYSGQFDVCIGTPVAGRQRAETDSMIGFFVNTLALRLRSEPRRAFSALVADTLQVARRAFSHQDVPFEQVVDALKLERGLSYSPLFQAMFVLQESRSGALSLPGLQVSMQTRDSEAAKFDLSLTITQEAGKLQCLFHYSSALFDAASIARMGRHFSRLLASVAENPELALADLTMLDGAERTELLHTWNATAQAYPQGHTLQSLLQQQAERSPRSLALVSGDLRLDYATLNARANRLAHYLRKMGVGPEVLVGVAMERSAEMVLALLATVKAGGAYLPLEPSYPRDRLEYMLEDARPAIILTQAALRDQLHLDGTPFLCLDRDYAVLDAFPDHDPVELARPGNAAYVIYTSGSTGRPKGVVVDHAGIVNRLQWMQQAYGLTAADRVLQKTPFSFDVSVWEFFWPLMTGASLVVARPGGHQDPHYLAQVVAQEGITTMHFVPPMLDVFLDASDLASCRGLRQVMCSGQALPPELQNRFLAALPGVQLHNLYGPTEASVDVTYWHCNANPLPDCVPIGHPIANIRIHILDECLNPVPVGVAGQLYIAGVGLARGYLNKPELTASKFIPNPHSPEAGARMYASGDLARYRADGSIEYLGRLDDQVKIRGFRIELGEIEVSLTALSGVREAVVMARRDGPAGEQLVAYVVGPSAEPGAGARLKAALAHTLPDYMVPSHCVVLDAMPLSANGKVDRRALPAPELHLARADFVAPATATENVLAGMWAALLQVERVGTRDSFFDLGGNSLLAVQLHQRICSHFGERLSIIDLFKFTTIDKLARFLDQAVPEPAAAQESQLRATQRRQRTGSSDARIAARSQAR